MLKHAHLNKKTIFKDCNIEPSAQYSCIAFWGNDQSKENREKLLQFLDKRAL